MRLFQSLILASCAVLCSFFPAGSAPPRQSAAPSQNQRPGPPGTIRVRVGLVPVDVLVTDDHDRPVTDLKQEDFQILENGRPQEIRHFSVQTMAPAAAEPGQPTRIRLVPTLELAPQQARTFLILLGRGRHNQGLKAVDALIQFIRQGLLPQDRVAVYAYNRASDFTTDHEQIAQALEQYKKVADKIESWLEGRLRGFGRVYGTRELPKALQSEVNKIFDSVPQLASRQIPPGRLNEEGTIVREWDKAAGIILGNADRAAETGMRVAVANDVAASGVETGAQTMQSMLRFDQLQADAVTLSLPFDEFIPRAADSIEDMQNIFTCIEYLRYVEGEKHLLFFSGKGLLFPYGRDDYDKGIAAVANDARVAIDTFHTGGLAPTIMPTQGVTLASTTRGSTTTTAPPPPMGSVFSWGDTAQGQSLRTISAITGGRAAIYQDIGKALEVINETTRVQYLLGYYPQDERFDGRYRQITIKVNRPGVRVYSRRGYFARDKLQPYDKAEFLAFSRISAAAAWAESNHIDDVPFKLNTSKAQDDSGQPQVKVDLKIDAAKIGFKTVKDLHAGRLRIAIFSGAINGASLGEDWKTIDLQLQEATYKEYLKSGIPYSVLIPMKQKSMFLKVIIYDYTGDRIGSKTVRVESFLAP